MRKICAENLTKSFKGRIVVNGVSLSVSEGEVVGLLGPNGAGKTTTFYMIVGLIEPDSGKVKIDDKDIGDEPMYKRARQGLSYLPQEPSVFRKLSVEDNIKAVLEGFVPQSDIKAMVDEQLESLSITHIRNLQGYSLSGGERRRVEIARAMAKKPSFILLDEPFAGVDPIAVSDIQDIVRDLKEQGVGVLITDHNVGATLGICDRAYIVESGKVLMSGTPSEIVDSKEVQNAYLGEGFKL